MKPWNDRGARRIIIYNQALPRCGRLERYGRQVTALQLLGKGGSFLICINADRREEDATVIYQKAPHYRSGEQE